MAGQTHVPSSGGANLGPDAYKRLYPAEFYRQFIINGMRPDGRSFGTGRPVTIGVGAIESTTASALVKIGSTSVLAGLSFTVAANSGDIVTHGELEISVTMTTLSLGSIDRKKGLEASQVLTYLVNKAIVNSKALDLSKLASRSGKASLKASLEIHVLDADGAVLDASLLAAAAAFASVSEIPHLSALDEADKELGKQAGPNADRLAGFCQLEKLPLYHTIGLYGEHLMVDPSDEEASLMDGQISLALDSHGSILGLDASKPAHSSGIGLMKLTHCIEAAKLRHRDVRELLDQALST